MRLRQFTNGSKHRLDFLRSVDTYGYASYRGAASA
jgi:hypothetical protein